MVNDLDETRLAKAIKAFWDAPGGNHMGLTAAITAIAAWEASAPKPESATEAEIMAAWDALPEYSAEFGTFHAGVRWAESRMRAQPEPQARYVIPQYVTPLMMEQPPRSGMTKAEREGLLAALDWHSKPGSGLTLSKMADLAAAIRKETPDA